MPNRTRVFPETVVEQAQKEEIERHLHAARKVMHDALKQCRDQKINPAAVAQVLGENAVMLMIRNFGPDAGKHFSRSLSEEATRMAHYYKTEVQKPAD
jgi:hypothetical protein